MDYGYFDDPNREYVITNPCTPVKWINYIGSLDFGGFVDHTAGALICQGDPALNRILKYIPQLPDSAFKGQTLYLRIPDGNGYRVFSPFYVPTLDEYQSFECRVGMGYTRFETCFYGLQTEALIFVPPGERVMVQRFRITNQGDIARSVDAIPVIEYSHFDALKQFTNADWIPQTMQSDAIEEDGRVILVQYPFMLRGRRVNYFTANLRAGSYETDRRDFLGANGYGTWAAPLSLQASELGNSQARRGDNIGALLLHLGELQPGEMCEFIVLLGQAPGLGAARPVVEQYRQPENVQAAFDLLTGFWQDYLARFQVETPDPELDRMLNIHNPRQCYITLNWSRYLSLYQLGFGARGIGFRDSSQDVMGVLANAPDEGRALITRLLQVQKRDGSAMHQFNPLTMIANQGDSQQEEDRPHYYSDDHLWAVLAATAYLKETGDLDFLHRALAFYEKDRQEKPVESGPVWEHLQRALAFTHGDLGAHGLPLLGFADWNDTVNLPAGAESIFTACLYGRALLEMIDLACLLEKEDAAGQYRRWYREMRAAVEAHGWDGDWYRRYYTDAGEPVGSHSNEQGQIFLNAQSWAVIAGFASPERAAQAMESAYRRLNTRNGIKLSAPGYDGYDPEKGGVTTYPPGAKENGGIFLHANPWAIIAECMLGNGERAYQYYTQINPAARNDRIDEFECEPYVYPQNILGDEHPRFGLARNSWLTGTASWAYQAAQMYILGLQPHYDGLRIDPCIPPAWNGFKARRTFRGAIYHVQVENPDHVSRGVAGLTIDGRSQPDNSAPLFTGGEHQVVVVMGAGN